MEEWVNAIFQYSSVPLFHYLRGFKPKDGFFFLALNGSEFTYLKADMTPWAKTRFNISDAFPFLPISRRRHLPSHQLIRDGRATQADTCFPPNTFGGINLKRLIIFLKSPSKECARAFADDEGRFILFEFFFDHLLRLFQIPWIQLSWILNA